jgi:hypothetical protein
MKRIVMASALVFALALPAASQPAIPVNPQIEVSYAEPTDQRLQAVHKRMVDLKVLETLQQFLAPLKLEQKLAIRFEQCGALEASYRPGLVTICYEQVHSIYGQTPLQGATVIGNRFLTWQQAATGAIVQHILRQVAVAVLEIKQIPIFGRLDDAADNVSGVLMLEFGEDVAWVTLMGSAWYFAQSGLQGAGFFTDTLRGSDRPTNAQRFYKFLCLAYGARPGTYQFLVNNFNLPQGHANFCRQDYQRLRLSFRQTILPHVDLELMKQVQGRVWIRTR